MSKFRRSCLGLTFVVLTAVPLVGQGPPAEIRFDVLMDVGRVPASSTCGCVTQPFQVLAAPDTDAPPSRAQQQMQRERDREAVASFQSTVEDGLAGNGNASFAMGMELTADTAVMRNDVEAARWFLLAAQQGHPDAYVQVGHRYHRGLGLPQSDDAAAYWFYQGATHGERLGMIALGSLYAAGRGVPQDWTLAISWWRKANYYRFIGDAYACGLGVAQSNDRAVREYQKGESLD